MRVGSLFSGIGGLDLGLQRAGMEIVWQVEIDEWCRRVLARHFPDAVRYSDVRACHGAYQMDDAMQRGYLSDGQTQAESHSDGAQDGLSRSASLDAVDLICGGFPCQPVSHAGRRLGTKDDRWLWPEFLRIIREVRPRWALVENVPGLLSIEDGRLFGGILRDLAESGYDAEWDCIPAAALGAPHIRDRVFIVAHASEPRDGRLSVRPGEPRSSATHIDGCGETIPDTSGSGQRAQQRDVHAGQPDAARRGEMADTNEPGLEIWEGFTGDNGSQCATPERNSWWATEPDVGRVAHGVPSRVDRLRGLGNAVVPQVAEYIGRALLAGSA